MPASFVSESITPLDASFDTAGMSRGEPGVPRRFRWRKREITVAGVLESWKEYGDCTHGSGERYLRKHGYRLKTTDGMVLKVYFQRTGGRSTLRSRARWWISRIETGPTSAGTEE